MAPYAKRRSTFSDSNLTALESLVLEVALEDALSTQQQTAGVYEMPKEDYDELMAIPGNNACFDCHVNGHDKAKPVEWCSVSFGIFLCAKCSGEHRSLGTHISRVRSMRMDSWSEDFLERMRQGGNRAFQDFLKRNKSNLPPSAANDSETFTKELYTSSAAESYKAILTDRVAFAVSGDAEKDDSESCSFASEEAEIDPVVAALSNISYEGSNGEEEGKEEGLMNDTGLQKDRNGNDKTSLKFSLDRWFAKAPGSATNNIADAVSDAMADATSLFLSSSIHTTGARKSNCRRSLSSASTPTITYMGRSFSANSEDLKNVGTGSHHHRHSIHSSSNLMSRSDLAQKDEQLAKMITSNALWRTSPPPSYWTADKKVEPFTTLSASSSGSVHNSGTSRRPSAHRTSVTHSTVPHKLSFTESDLLNVAMDDDEFARLKAGLKSRGAVTNEVLKQKLYAFIANSKKRQEVRRSSINELREDREGGASQDTLGLSYTIHASTLSRETNALS